MIRGCALFVSLTTCLYVLSSPIVRSLQVPLMCMPSFLLCNLRNAFDLIPVTAATRALSARLLSIEICKRNDLIAKDSSNFLFTLKMVLIFKATSFFRREIICRRHSFLRHYPICGRILIPEFFSIKYVQYCESFSKQYCPHVSALIC
jgi:hypothetical protein